MPNIPGLEVMQTSLVISCPIVLLVEGKDEIHFFAALFRHMGPENNIKLIEINSYRSKQYIVKNMNTGANIVELREVGGKERLHIDFPAFLLDPGFYQVKAYAIIQDADSSATNTLRSVQKILKDNNQPCPNAHSTFVLNNDNTLKVGVFIMPGTSTGMLENLCLSSVKDHPIMPHVSYFMKRVKETMGDKGPKNESKATVQAFLSGMPDPITSVGTAAQKHCWPFDDGVFDNLRSFLEQLSQ